MNKLNRDTRDANANFTDNSRTNGQNVFLRNANSQTIEKNLMSPGHAASNLDNKCQITRLLHRKWIPNGKRINVQNVVQFKL